MPSIYVDSILTAIPWTLHSEPFSPEFTAFLRPKPLLDFYTDRYKPMETSRLAASEDDMEMTGANGSRGPAVEVEEVSDGGLRAWLTVAGVMLVQMAGFGYCSSYGVFQDYYTRVYITNASPLAISWVGSLSAFLLNASGLITGPLYDRGYFSIMFYSGYFLSVLCLYLLSLAKPNHLYQVFLSQGLGFGIAGGLINLPTFAILPALQA
ncbi:hypothetical protein DFP72DRAFT_908024 [Ephemerocybe angulata]|uniref:Uncharacterized protein n=1 Tax=Ephemerocybe angulata TaxID=980116 RepID=A0A8H6M4L5_9AGAR|nr:hypothetical protein DFP72DRAFT_908024 [Tulosesus angulatus]